MQVFDRRDADLIGECFGEMGAMNADVGCDIAHCNFLGVARMDEIQTFAQPEIRGMGERSGLLFREQLPEDSVHEAVPLDQLLLAKVVGYLGHLVQNRLHIRVNHFTPIRVVERKSGQLHQLRYLVAIEGEPNHLEPGFTRCNAIRIKRLGKLAEHIPFAEHHFVRAVLKLYAPFPHEMQSVMSRLTWSCAVVGLGYVMPHMHHIQSPALVERVGFMNPSLGVFIEIFLHHAHLPVLAYPS